MTSLRHGGEIHILPLFRRCYIGTREIVQYYLCQTNTNKTYRVISPTCSYQPPLISEGRSKLNAEGCPLPSKTVRSTSTPYHHLIGLAEIYQSEHDHQIAIRTVWLDSKWSPPDTNIPQTTSFSAVSLYYPMSALLVGCLEKWQNQIASVKSSFKLYPLWHN